MFLIKRPIGLNGHLYLKYSMKWHFNNYRYSRIICIGTMHNEKIHLADLNSTIQNQLVGDVFSYNYTRSSEDAPLNWSWI